MVHGDDWKYGKDKDLRQKAINSLRKVGGKLIEIPFTRNISSSDSRRIYEQGTTTSNRQIILQRLLEVKNICKFLEAHSPLSAIIAEKTFIKIKMVLKKNLTDFGLAHLLILL